MLREPKRSHERADTLSRAGSPAPLAPLPDLRALGAQGRVVAVAGVDVRVVAQLPEDLRLQVVHQRRELRRARGLARAAGEERVAGEEVPRARGVAVEQRDRAGGVAVEVDDLDARAAELDRVAVADG